MSKISKRGKLVIVLLLLTARQRKRSRKSTRITKPGLLRSWSLREARPRAFCSVFKRDWAQVCSASCLAG